MNKKKIRRKSTDRQKAAVRFCETWVKISFNGNIDDFDDCSKFLGEYLDSAKDIALEVSCDYEAYMFDRL